MSLQGGDDLVGLAGDGPHLGLGGRGRDGQAEALQLGLGVEPRQAIRAAPNIPKTAIDGSGATTKPVRDVAFL